MIVRFENCELKLEEILKEVDTVKHFNENELIVVDMIRDWMNGEPLFTFHTSGSTGVPKPIIIPREKIAFSVRATMNFLDPERRFRSSLLCINPHFIGGAMVVFRALVHEMDLTIISPSADLDSRLKDTNYDLVSMVPLQAQKLSVGTLNNFHAIIIGGGQMPAIEGKTTAKVYSSFGMTETVSHFAFKELNKPYFRVLDGTEIAVNKSGNLKVKNFITDDKWLETNDMISLISSNEFLWIGRSDFVINTGGIKVNPESVEKKLSDQFEGVGFFISSLPDKVLENSVVLMVEGQDLSFEPDFSMLEKHHRPKGIVFLDRFERTASEKIDRKKTREKLIAIQK